MFRWWKKKRPDAPPQAEPEILFCPYCHSPWEFRGLAVFRDDQANTTQKFDWRCPRCLRTFQEWNHPPRSKAD